MPEGLGGGLAVERPQPDGSVRARGNDARAIGRKGHARDLAVVPPEWVGGGPAVERPQPDGSVGAAGDDLYLVVRCTLRRKGRTSRADSNFGDFHRPAGVAEVQNVNSSMSV